MKTKRLTAIVIALMCIPLCGAWSAASAGSPTETRYTGGQAISTYATETIAYTTKTVVEDISTANDAPYYRPIDGLTNSCGAVAGAITVGFYDKYYPNLIQGWDSATSTGRYRAQDNVYVPALITDLYSAMQTNVVAPGVSRDEFTAGLKDYVNRQGYTFGYQSVYSGSFDYNTFKTAVKNNQVTVLFIYPSNYYQLRATTGADTLTSTYITGNHIMVAYGYYEVRYTLNGGSTRTDKYLKVSTGLSNKECYYKVGSDIQSAYTVKIN